MLMQADSKSRFWVFLAGLLLFSVLLTERAVSDTPEQRQYWEWALKWAREVGVTDRCYNEFSTDLIEEEATAGAFAMQPGIWAGISGARNAEADELIAAMKSAHAMGFSSDETCFMSLMMRDSSRELVVSGRRLVKLKQ